MLSADQIVEIDKAHCWHPYSSFINPPPAFPVESAQGVRIQIKDGPALIDGMASWWSVIHGYNHPVLNEAIKAQVDKVSHVMFGGLTHEPAAELTQRLVETTPEALTKVFFSDSGSVAVEVAMKMALQYWHSQGHSEKNRLITVRHGYHGDTFAAMSVCDPVTGMHHLFSKVLPEQIFCDAPPEGYFSEVSEEVSEELRGIFERHHHESAAFIIEPIAQGAGGMRFYPPAYLRLVRELCTEFGVLLILDEIATGFGRTGEMFGCNHADVTPDIMAVGKALTGGYMTLAATLCSDRIAEGICYGEAGVFMHGPTFMANPLACRVASASIRLLQESDWKSEVQRISAGLVEGLSPARELSGVKDVRVLGAIGVVQLNQPVNMRQIGPILLEEGIWLRPFGKLVYMMPAYVMSDQDLAFLCEKTCRVIERISQS